MSKLLALRGISGSGKSTYARELKAQNWVVVSRDDIRETMFKDYQSVDEDVVTLIEDTAIAASLRAGRNVVVDDTNIRLKYLKRFAEIALKCNATFDVKQFDMDVAEACRRVGVRAAEGGRLVPATVIQKQAQGLKSAKVNMQELFDAPAFEPYETPVDGIKAIIVDVDGTIAHNDGHRGWYDYSLVSGDKVQEKVAQVVRWAKLAGFEIIIMSGRDDECQDDTIDWLDTNEIPWDHIHMRKTGDQRKDSIVKIELFDQHVRDKFDIQFCLDDRNQVVDAWRSIGLTVFQVAEGNF